MPDAVIHLLGHVLATVACLARPACFGSYAVGSVSGPHLFAAEHVDGLAVGQGEEPVGKASRVTIEAGGVADHCPKDLLDDLLSQVPILDDTHRERVGEPGVGIVEHRRVGRGIVCMNHRALPQEQGPPIGEGAVTC